MSLPLRLGLRGRLLVLLVLAFCVLATATVWHGLAHRAEMVSFATAQLVSQARVIAARQQFIKAHADAILSGLMQRPESQPGAKPDQCTQAFATRRDLETEFVQIGVVTPDGRVACAAVPPEESVDVSDRSWFEGALRGEGLVVSGMMLGRIVAKPVVVFAKAQRDHADRATAVYYAALSLAWLEQEMAGAGLPPGAHLALVDGEGEVLFHHPGHARWGSKDLAASPLSKALSVKGVEGSLEGVGLDGVVRIYAFTPLLDTIKGPMRLVMSMPREAATAPAQREIIVALAAAMALLLLVLALLYWGGEKWLFAPLVRLSWTMARFGAGDHGARTGLRYGDDEIGRLARAFDEAAAIAEAREQDLAHSNRALRLLSAGNRVMLRERDEPALIQAICQAALKAGGYLTAWVGYAEHDAHKHILIAAQRGGGTMAAMSEDLGLTWGEEESGKTPLGEALRGGRIVMLRDLRAYEGYAPWCELVLRNGCASCIVLPLRVAGQVVAVLGIGAAQADAFGKEEVKLLAEVAADVSYGISARRAELEQDKLRGRLESSETRYRAVVQASLDALFLLSPVRDAAGEITDFQFTDLNPSAEALLDMTREQAIGKLLCELIPINRTSGFFDKYVKVLATGEPLEEEFPIDAPQIRAKWLRHQVVRVEDGIVISSRDITAWKETSAAVRLLGRQKRMILDAAGEGIFGLDLEGRVTFINPAGEAMLQWTSEEVMGKHAHDLHHHTRVDGQPYPKEDCPILESYRDGEIRRVSDEVFWRNDGTNFPVDYVSTPIRDDAGVLVGAVVAFSDITERRAREQALAHANRALKTLSAGNMALVRAKDEQALLEEVCRVVVEAGGYRMAWVGYADDNPEKTITPRAWTGVEDGYLAQLHLTWADVERGLGPNSRAIRAGETQVVHDLMGDPGFELWRELAEERGYASVFSHPLKVSGRVIGALGIYAAEADAFDDGEIKLLQELGNDLAFGIETLRIRDDRDHIAYQHEHHAEILQKSLEDSIRAIAYTVEMRDAYTAGHERRVGELAVAIAQELGLDEHKVHGIRLAATVHDLGKINVPAEILSKPGRLSDIEFMLIQTHPLAGYNILKDVEFPWPIAQIVLQHHEKLDGSGYPQGLKDGEILLESRIMTVADVVEAMVSHRPYRPGLGIDKALQEIERGRGSVYDATVVDACLKLFREKGFVFQG